MYTPVLGPPYRTVDGYAGTRGTNTRGSVNWTGTVPVPRVPGTRFSVRRGTFREDRGETVLIVYSYQGQSSILIDFDDTKIATGLVIQCPVLISI